MFFSITALKWILAAALFYIQKVYNSSKYVAQTVSSMCKTEEKSFVANGALVFLWKVNKTTFLSVTDRQKLG